MPPLKVEDARASFLYKSSLLLASSSPSTSAYLTTERVNRLLQDEGYVPEALRQEFCTACGSLLFPGWNSSFTRACRDGKKRKSEKQTGGKVKSMSFTRKSLTANCHACHSETVHVLPSPSKTQRVSSSKVKRAPPSTLLSSSTAQATTDKSTAKKRAKARKEKLGLHALLSKSKEMSAPSSSLDLMDFMKA